MTSHILARQSTATFFMPCYCVQSRAATGPMRTYWVNAHSCKVARALVALNVAGSQGARDKKLFDCFEDDTRIPPPGMIYSHTHGPIPILIVV